MQFLSERNIEMHEEYLKKLKLKYGVFEKSYPTLCGAGLREIYRARLPLSEREEAARLFAEIRAHGIFFSSFANKNLRCPRIERAFGSVASFLYEIGEYLKGSRADFLFIFEEKGKIRFKAECEYEWILEKFAPPLALDLCEHAYFSDYGFDREGYISSAISHFDFSKIEKSDF